MDSVDQQVLRNSVSWFKDGHKVVLATIVDTWGSSPRPPGAMLAIRGDGQVAGSVSGGCVEDDLIAKIKENSLSIAKPTLTVYGVTKAEAQKFGLPCGGTLKIVLEPLTKDSMLGELLERVERQELTKRTLNMETGEVKLGFASRDDVLTADEKFLSTLHGPRWRLLIIGAGQLSEYIAQMAEALDYYVTVCDPRSEYSAGWSVEGSTLTKEMPDDVVNAMNVDVHTAVIAVTHDPKLDDLALMEALKSPAFYVGALGSRVNSSQRRKRLALFDLTENELDRLHGPVGLRIGGKTPPEIAVSIMAEMTAVRHGVALETIGTKASKSITAEAKSEICEVESNMA